MANVRMSKSISIVADTQLEVVPKTYDKLDMELARRSAEAILPNQIHVHIPICVGYPETVTPVNLIALISSIEERGYSYTIYLSPKDEQALSAWYQSNANVARQCRNNIMHIDDWRKSDAWKEAKRDYDKYYSSEKKVGVENALSQDVHSYTKRSKPEVRTSIQNETRIHVIEEGVDCLSWMRPSSFQDKKIAVLAYSRTLSNLMRHLIQCAGAIGCVPDSLIHARFETQVMQKKAGEESQNQVTGISPVNYIDQVTAALIKNGADASFTGKVLASFVSASATSSQQASGAGSVQGGTTAVMSRVLGVRPGTQQNAPMSDSVSTPVTEAEAVGPAPDDGLLLPTVDQPDARPAP